MKDRTKEIGLGLLAFITYFGLSLVETVPFKLAGVKPYQISSNLRILYMLVFEILMFSILLIVFNQKVEKDLNDIIKNHKDYFSKCINYYLIGLMVMVVSNSILALLTNGGIAGNEETVRAMFKTNPIYMYLSAVVFAPIIEELVFRQGIRNICGKNVLFIVISGLVFGALHVFTSATTLIDVLYIIPYSALGISFAVMLYKTDNIFVSMGFHFMHNGILMAIQFMAFLF